MTSWFAVAKTSGTDGRKSCLMGHLATWPQKKHLSFSKTVGFVGGGEEEEERDKKMKERRPFFFDVCGWTGW